MPANPHLEPQLDAYLALAKPGFALMVDAPWGAGKTHSVERWLAGKKHLFVSLYGATSREDIERAIVVARLNAMDNNASRALAAVIRAGVEVAASYLGVSKPNGLQKVALAMLPDLIVFDDLERTEGIPVHSLLGVLNRYVEHEERHVILLANQVELRKGCDDYDRVREKVIGRVITLEPDEDKALVAFLDQLKGNPSHAFLLAQREVILSVFRTSECQNLRLLRQALLEYARLHSMIPEDLKNLTEPMQRALATFLALTIAFHEGKDFGVKDLEQDDDALVAAMMARSKDESLSAMGYDALVRRYEKHRFVSLHQTAIPGFLSKAFIGGGHVSGDLVERGLRDAAVFLDAEFEDWRKLWWWQKTDAGEIHQALASIRGKLSAKSIHDPYIVLHVSGIFLKLSEVRLIADSKAEVVSLMTDYVRELRVKKIFTPELPVYRWDDDFRHGAAYGLGFHCRENKEFRQIADALVAAINGAFWDRSHEIADPLLILAEKDPTHFRRAIREKSSSQVPVSYAYVPILAKTNPQRAAQLFCALPPGQAHDVLGPLKDRISTLERHKTQEQGVDEPDERAWLIEVRDEIGKIAAATEDPIRKAQLLALIDWNLRFLDPQPADA